MDNPPEEINDDNDDNDEDEEEEDNVSRDNDNVLRFLSFLFADRWRAQLGGS